jgi:hypothetical protein
MKKFSTEIFAMLCTRYRLDDFDFLLLKEPI